MSERSELTSCIYYMWQLQVENEHYSVFNWLNSIRCPACMLKFFSSKLGTLLAYRQKVNVKPTLLIVDLAKSEKVVKK